MSTLNRHCHRFVFALAPFVVALLGATVMFVAVSSTALRPATAATGGTGDIVASAWAVPMDLDHNGKINVGDHISYTIIVTNTGGAGVSNLIVKDSFLLSGGPQPVELLTDTLSTTSGLISAQPPFANAGMWLSGVISNSIATLNSGGSVTIRFETVVRMNADTTVFNSATVNSGSDLWTPPITSSNVVSTVIQAVPDAGITIAQSGNWPRAGAKLVFAGTVSGVGFNTSPGPSVIVSATVPAYATFDGTSSYAVAWNCANGAVPGTICSVTLPNFYNSGMVWFPMKLDDLIPRGATLTGTLSITAPGDTNPLNNTATITLPIDTSRLEVLKLGSLSVDANGNGMADPGDEITYSVFVTNSGTGDSPPLGILDYLPASWYPPPVSLVDLITPSLSTTVGTITATEYSGLTSVQATLGQLSPGATAHIKFTTKVSDNVLPNFTSIVNVAQVQVVPPPTALVGPYTLFDTNPVTIPLTPRVDLILSVSTDAFDRATPKVGKPDVKGFGILVHNAGSITATNVVITQPLPSYLLLANNNQPPTSVSGPNSAPLSASWTCASELCTINLGSLGPSQSTQAWIGIVESTTLPIHISSFVNRVTTGDDGTHGPDTNPLDNTAVLTIPVGYQTALTVTSSVAFVYDDDPANHGQPNNALDPGDIVQYTIVARNIGTRVANDVSLVDSWGCSPMARVRLHPPTWTCRSCQSCQALAARRVAHCNHNNAMSWRKLVRSHQARS